MLLLLTLACEEPFDTERNPPARGTLGEEIFKIFHRDFEREAPRRAEGFSITREGFVQTVDHLIPEDETTLMQDFMVRLLPLHDDNTLPSTTQRTARLLQRLAEDREAVRALAAIGHRIGYVDLNHEEALIRRIASFPQYEALVRAILDLALLHDGLDETGAPTSEDDTLARLQTLLADELESFELSEDAERNIVLAADLLLSEDPRFAAGEDALIVARDLRGMARVRPAALEGFLDSAPADGLADINESGQFLGPSGAALDRPPFGTQGQRDPQGRLLMDDGQPVFQYIDMDRTLLAGLLRDTKGLIEQGVPMKAVRTLDHVLGERTNAGTYGALNSPLLEVLHAVSRTADTPQLPDVIELLEILLQNHEATLMWIALETEAQLDIARRHDVGLAPNNSFENDLLSWVRRVLEVPGFAEQLIDVLQDPALDTLPEVQAQLMSYKNDLITEADYDDARVFIAPVNRNQPDITGNQSIMQRMLHLMYDTRGADYTPEIIGLPLGFIFEIDDLAEFYILSIIGQTEVPGLVSTLTGLPERPSPIDLARFINEDQTFGNPEGNEGIDVKDNDGDTLFAVTASGMEDVLRPLVQLFYDHDQMRLLYDLFELLHLHWASPQSDYQSDNANTPRYSKRSGLSRYEPLMIEVFQQTHVLDGARALLSQTRGVRTQSDQSGHALVLTLARKLLTKDPALRTRDDKGFVLIDGDRVTPLAPIDLLEASFDRLDQTLSRSNEARSQWDEVTDALYELLLEPERTGPESGQLKNRRALPVATLLLSFLRERALRHQSQGNLQSWIREDMLGGVEDTLTGKGLPVAFDLLYILDEDEQLEAPLLELRDELLNEGFTELLVTLGDGMQAAQDAQIAVPLMRFLGRELRPEKQLIFSAAQVAQKSLEIDTDAHMLELIRRAIEPDPAGELYVGGLSTSIRQINRLDPLDMSTPDATDTEMIVSGIARYLLNEESGVEKFYNLVRNRKLEPVERAPVIPQEGEE